MDNGENSCNAERKQAFGQRGGKKIVTGYRGPHKSLNQKSKSQKRKARSGGRVGKKKQNTRFSKKRIGPAPLTKRLKMGSALTKVMSKSHQKGW